MAMFITYMTYILYATVLVIAVPTGLILAKICREEIKKWEKRLIAIMIIALVLAIVFLFVKTEIQIPLIITFTFIIITNISVLWRKMRK
jgi:hypothetical protein